VIIKVIREKIYLDTTVPSIYYDYRTPDRQKLTKEFWHEKLSDFEIFIYELVVIEINKTPENEKRKNLKELVKDFRVLEITEETDALATEYIKKGVFTEKTRDDALHVAIAVVNGIHYLASWNYRHMVKVKTCREVNLINSLMGYRAIEIVAPPEL